MADKWMSISDVARCIARATEFTDVDFKGARDTEFNVVRQDLITWVVNGLNARWGKLGFPRHVTEQIPDIKSMNVCDALRAWETLRDETRQISSSPRSISWEDALSQQAADHGRRKDWKAFVNEGGILLNLPEVEKLIDKPLCDAADIARYSDPAVTWSYAAALAWVTTQDIESVVDMGVAFGGLSGVVSLVDPHDRPPGRIDPLAANALARAAVKRLIRKVAKLRCTCARLPKSDSQRWKKCVCVSTRHVQLMDALFDGDIRSFEKESKRPIAPSDVPNISFDPETYNLFIDSALKDRGSSIDEFAIRAADVKSWAGELPTMVIQERRRGAAQKKFHRELEDAILKFCTKRPGVPQREVVDAMRAQFAEWIARDLIISIMTAHKLSRGRGKPSKSRNLSTAN